jgi:hypothetical protein
MKSGRLLVTLTAVNAVLLVFLLAQMRPVEASADSPVLRGRGLEITDDQGRVRASIKIHPADPNVRMPDGSRGIPETVVLRLIDQHGRPGVKIAGAADGAGMSLVGDTHTWAVLSAKGADTTLQLKTSDGRELVVKATQAPRRP